MESGGGSGNKTTGGLAGFFGAGGASYSHADLAGVPLTGMNPLSPYLNVDPRYLVQDTDEFILPTGANKTRGRFELAFFTIGGCCMTGAAFGAMNGLRLGLKETQNMSWSKPRNVQILNMVTRQGALWANTLGSLALLYSAFGVIIEKTRGAEDDLNTVAAGTMTGMLYKCTVIQRERETETQAEGEAGSMHREPDVGLDPGSPGSRPGPKAGAKPLRHPGIPVHGFFDCAGGGVASCNPTHCSRVNCNYISSGYVNTYIIAFGT
uniref:mitochondrial import inner membrane translocase subunit Tim23B isoform X1 n=1 Tax=Nyctereutes procyonoides TaxID=34880 RepID=UPI0024439E5F|nr:mitochondrial import inner membrane translocase subunit Tim23B isoform X1 [Nyctereutes procyonoides]